MTAIATVATGVAALVTVVFAYKATDSAENSAKLAYESLELQKKLTLPSESSVKVEGNSGSLPCPPVSRDRTIVSGIATMQRSEKVWILLSAPGEGVIYVPGRAPTEPDQGTHAWSEIVSEIGSDDDAGNTFEIFVVAADANANAFLTRVANGAGDTHVVRSLPGGSRLMASHCVTRK